MTDGDLTPRLAALNTGALSDVLDAMGVKGQVLSLALRPMAAGMRLAGPAFCVRGVTLATGVAPPPGRISFGVDRHLRPGGVVLIETGGHRDGAIIGGNVSQGYRNHGCVGAIADGPVRDVEDFRAQDFAVFATGLSPMSSKGRWAFAEFGVPIRMPGQAGTLVTVAPGDQVLADAEGVVVLPQAIAAQAIAAAERLIEVETVLLAALASGMDRQEAYAMHDPRAHIRPLATTPA